MNTRRGEGGPRTALRLGLFAGSRAAGGVSSMAESVEVSV